MSVVLQEAPYLGQSSQRSESFVMIYYAEFGQSYWRFFITSATSY